MLSMEIAVRDMLPRHSPISRLRPRGYLRAGICAAFLALFAVSAFADTLRVRDFHAELDVLPDSSVDVTETIQVDFTGARNGIWN